MRDLSRILALWSVCKYQTIDEKLLRFFNRRRMFGCAGFAFLECGAFPPLCLAFFGVRRFSAALFGLLFVENRKKKAAAKRRTPKKV